MKHIYMLCGQNAEIVNVKVGGTIYLPLSFKGLKEGTDCNILKQ
jgi:hypothetical protein